MAEHIDKLCSHILYTVQFSLSLSPLGARIIKICEQWKRKARDLDTKNTRGISENHKKKGSINKHINTKAKVFLPHGRHSHSIYVSILISTHSLYVLCRDIAVLQELTQSSNDNPLHMCSGFVCRRRWWGWRRHRSGSRKQKTFFNCFR